MRLSLCLLLSVFSLIGEARAITVDSTQSVTGTWDLTSLVGNTSICTSDIGSCSLWFQVDTTALDTFDGGLNFNLTAYHHLGELLVSGNNGGPAGTTSVIGNYGSVGFGDGLAKGTFIISSLNNSSFDIATITVLLSMDRNLTFVSTFAENLSSSSAVPLPPALALFALGFGLLGFLGWKGSAA